MRTIIAAAVAVMLAGAAGAKAQLWGDWTADNLRTGCAPMALEVQLVGKAEADERLRERLTNSAESRLRAAGLFIEPPPVQWLTLDVLGSASEGQSTPDIAKYSVTLSPPRLGYRLWPGRRRVCVAARRHCRLRRHSGSSDRSP